MPTDPTPATFEIGDWVDITFRKAVVVDVAANGSIRVQNAGPSFWVHPDDNDTQVDKLGSVESTPAAARALLDRLETNR